MGHDLTISEELALLGLSDEKGTVAFGTYFDLALGAGLLSELALSERIDLVKVKKSMLVELRDATPASDPALNAAIEKLADAKRRASAQTWVSRFSQIKRLRHEIAGGLVERGILDEDERKVLLIFSKTVYPERDAGPERALIERLRGAIFGDGDVDVRTAAVAGIAHATGLLNSAFDKRELKKRKKRIESLMESRPSAQAVSEAVAATQAAIVAATTAASIAATTAAISASS